MSLIRMKIDFDVSKATRDMRERLGNALAQCIDRVAVLQFEQVSEAFRTGGQPILKWPRMWADKVAGHYRAGGQTLRDTGELEGSFGVPPVKTKSGLNATSTISSSVGYAAFHQVGFQTSGPNYIPITKRGKTLHAPGANPNKEGLVRGVDYIVSFKGVTVPARPMIDYSDPINKKQMEEACADGLQVSFGG